MKKTIAFLLTFILIISVFAACAPTSPEPSLAPEIDEKPVIRIASLKGPTTMGMVKLFDDAENGLLDYKIENKLCGTPDEIVALTASGDIDIAAVPANLASTLYNKTEGGITALAINTLGVLNVLEIGTTVNSVADLAGKIVYSTGKGATPEYALNQILIANGLDPAADLTIEYKSEATEIAALMETAVLEMAQNDSDVISTIVVLPQPYATTVLMKNPEARIALDLTDEWEKADIDGSLLTGLTFATADFLAENNDLVGKFLADYAESVAWVNANNLPAAEMIANLGIVASPEIAAAALPYCAIVYIDGAEMKTALSGYLGVLFEQNPAAVGGKLPDEKFYYENLSDAES